MFLEIVSPEATLFSQEVDSVSVPGVNGEFQMLNSHAAIVSVLDQGKVSIQGADIVIGEEFKNHFSRYGNKFALSINGGHC